MPGVPVPRGGPITVSGKFALDQEGGGTGLDSGPGAVFS